eukprot:3733732-Pleurochrysis_carterae.AAC.1
MYLESARAAIGSGYGKLPTNRYVAPIALQRVATCAPSAMAESEAHPGRILHRLLWRVPSSHFLGLGLAGATWLCPMAASVGPSK